MLNTPIKVVRTKGITPRKEEKICVLKLTAKFSRFTAQAK